MLCEVTDNRNVVMYDLDSDSEELWRRVAQRSFQAVPLNEETCPIKLDLFLVGYGSAGNLHRGVLGLQMHAQICSSIQHGIAIVYGSDLLS